MSLGESGIRRLRRAADAVTAAAESATAGVIGCTATVRLTSAARAAMMSAHPVSPPVRLVTPGATSCAQPHMHVSAYYLRPCCSCHLKFQATPCRGNSESRIAQIAVVTAC